MLAVTSFLKKFSLLTAIALFGCSCKLKLHLVQTHQQLYPITGNLPVDSAVIKFYLPYKQSIDSQMNVVIGVAANEISRKKPEGTLNNFVADAIAYSASQHHISFDFVHSNYKGLRLPLSKGNVKVFQVYELFPFENQLVTVKFTGLQIVELFNYMAKQGGDLISNATFKIRNSKAEDILINGKLINPAKEYTVLTSDYMANGGDEAAIYVQAKDRLEYSLKVRDAILMYIKQHTQAGYMLNPKLDGRITIDKAVTDE